MDKKKKKSRKMPTAFGILLGLTVISAIATWIVPAGAYQMDGKVPIAGTYHLVEANPQGLWDIFQAPVTGFGDALSVAFFILVLGGFLGIIFETRAIDAVIGSTVKKYEGREKLLIPMLMILFAIGGTTYGMAEETIAFYPLIIPILLGAGYDLVTVILVIFIGSGCGVLGGLVDPFAVGIASGLADISIGDGMEYRFLMLVLQLGFAIFFVMRYAERVRKDPTKSVTYDLNESLQKKFKLNASEELVEMTPKRKKILAAFVITFSIMVISIIPWGAKFDINIFTDFLTWIKSSVIGRALVGSMLPWGDWYFTEMTVLFFISSIVCARIYGYDEQKTVALFMNGAKDLLSVALVLGVARGISVVLNDGMIIGTILHWGEMTLSQLSSTAFAIVTYLMYIPLTFLIPSTSGLATASMPIMAPLADFAGVNRAVVVMAFQAGAETMNFFSPTQCVLVGALAITGVPYSRWLKAIAPYLAGVIAISVFVVSLASVML